MVPEKREVTLHTKKLPDVHVRYTRIVHSLLLVSRPRQSVHFLNRPLPLQMLRASRIGHNAAVLHWYSRRLYVLVWKVVRIGILAPRRRLQPPECVQTRVVLVGGVE